MGDETIKEVPSIKIDSAPNNSSSNPCNDPDEIDDPISAYFKQRCSNASRYFMRKTIESDSGSSLGCFDVDSISLFGDEDVGDDCKLSPLVEQGNLKDTINTNKNRKLSSESSMSTHNPESHLEKQRVLAQKALMKFNSKMNEVQKRNSFLTPENSRESSALCDISSKLINNRLSCDDKGKKNWFQPNFSPNTPRFFNDELSSFGGEESENLPPRIESEMEFPEKEKSRQSQYAKQVNSMLKELCDLNMNSEIEFESCTKEEQINRFEEDEKKFKLENSGLLHNSGISQFSGVAEGEVATWPSESGNLQKPVQDSSKLSIGQFFNMRSNRVSSLMGSVADEKSLPLFEEKEDSKTLTESEVQDILKNDYSLPVCDSSVPEKLKPRRCLSTCDLNRASDISKLTRQSNESCSSNSTLLIQNILAEMESGLSGTEIYEKLIKSYGRRKIPEKDNKKKGEGSNGELVNNETPKSSKVPKRKGVSKCNKEEQVEGETRRQSNGLKNLDRQKSRSSSNVEYKENDQDIEITNIRANQSDLSLRNEKIRKLKGSKGFDASTPKLQNVKSQSEKFTTSCSKILLQDEDWEAPRVSSIQPTVDMNKSEISEENEKTILINSTIVSSEQKKNSTIVLKDTFTIEDTIIAGDLTVLSQRIDEMKGDGVCIVRSQEPEEPVLLTVVQKLSDLPKGSVDCSALTPLLRDQFPELLSTFPTPSKDQSTVSVSVLSPPLKKGEGALQDILVSEQGSWVKLPAMMGLVDKIYACAEVKRSIFIPISNISKNWLLVSIESVVLLHPSGSKLRGAKKKDEWRVLDFVAVSMKDTLISPNSQQSLQVYFTPKIPTKIDLKISFTLTQLLGRETQTRKVNLRTNNINPLNNINVIPKDSINFGIIADQCFDHRTVQVSFDGICELPLTVLIEETDSESEHFILKPLVSSSGTSCETESNSKFQHVFHEGEKQLLEFRIFFQPNILLDGANKMQDFRALLILKIGTRTESDGILQKIPIKGSVGFAKFLCNPSCSPLVFRATEKGQSITRAYPLKNVGSLPIAFSVKIINEDTGNEQEDNLFVGPKSFYLSRNEESAISITFNAKTSENCTKRLLILQMKPNGRAMYDVELIGLISETRPVSRTSTTSVLTKSITNSESVSAKLLSTTHSLSWPAVPLDKEMRQTFQIKLDSTAPATARISFKRNLDSFKLVNENNEKVHKIRKILKPDCPYNVTVMFRPDLVGAHHNAIFIETNRFNGKKMITLSGIGGMPNLFIGNVKSDLNGCKMLRLQNSSNSHVYSNTLEFKNEGRIPGFILIRPSMEVLSLSYELVIDPSCSVIGPDSKITVKISQRLKNDDLQQLLSEKDISKIATLFVVMGDEPSRLRLRRSDGVGVELFEARWDVFRPIDTEIKELVDSGKLDVTERLKLLTAKYHEEREMNLKTFDDSPGFEHLFLKSLKTMEVAVVVERLSEICEPTILLDEDETLGEFATICSAIDNTVLSTINSQKPNEVDTRAVQSKLKYGDWDASIFSTNSSSSHNRIAKWLETLEYPPEKP